MAGWRSPAWPGPPGCGRGAPWGRRVFSLGGVGRGSAGFQGTGQGPMSSPHAGPGGGVRSPVKAFLGWGPSSLSTTGPSCCLPGFETWFPPHGLLFPYLVPGPAWTGGSGPLGALGPSCLTGPGSEPWRRAPAPSHHPGLSTWPRGAPRVPCGWPLFLASSRQPLQLGL